MKNYEKRLMLMLALMLVFVVSCSSSSNSTGPEILDVAGVWGFIGQLTQDTCGVGAGYSSLIASITFNQSGNSVSTGRVDFALGNFQPYFTYAGTLTGNNVSMAAVDPYVLQDGGTVIHFGSGIDVQNIQDDAGSGSLNFTGACIQGCTGSCQTIWSGTWAKQ